MEAGRELDALVAEKVMGLCPGIAIYISEDELADKYRDEFLGEWRSKYGTEPPPEFVDEEVQEHVHCMTSGDYPPMKCGKCGGQPHPTIPAYSQFSSYAWKVIEKLTAWDERGVPLYWFKLNYDNNECWDVGFCRVEGHEDYATDDWHWQTVQHFKDVPLAICLAALKAVGYNKEEA